MSYSQEELEALLQNDEFIRWVFAPDAAKHPYWQNWVQQHPDRQAMVAFIRSIRAAAQVQEGSHELADQIWKDVQHQMDAPVRRMPWRRYAAAAAIVALLGTAGLWYAISGSSVAKRGLVVEKVSKVNVTAKNNGSAPRTVYLTDGSRITLGENSSIQYKNLLNGDKREVHLDGEAFFEVARDAERPFLVYSGGIVTKVLGTSFRVTGKDKIVVAVRSGKVAVSKELNADGEYILLPNEQVVFNKRQNTLNKTAVADAALVEPPAITSAALNFDEAPVTQVLDSLAGMYTVDIRYDHTLLAKCRVTVSLEQESLYDKLQLLCKVLDATFETHENVIYIKAQGCN